MRSIQAEANPCTGCDRRPGHDCAMLALSEAGAGNKAKLPASTGGLCARLAAPGIYPGVEMHLLCKGTIRRVKASGELRRRMRDTGLVPGTPFCVQGRAPLKDPVAIQLRNFTLTLRNNESDFIEVEVEEAS